MLATLALGVFGFVAIIATIILSVVMMAYRAQSPGKGYVSEQEQVGWIAGGLIGGAGLVGLLLGWDTLAVSLTILIVFCSSIVAFGLT